ncbi:transporter substrate-binding domain-containing protein [Klebsiella variicola subsp. variicola]|nr:transporter substrate-binding domain-containing protein [Klebsiella variicola subsp. variicola]
MKFFTSRFMSIFLLIPGMFLAQSPAQAGEEINTILPDHVIRVGAVNAPPWYQKDLLTNQWTGLVPDVVQAIFKNTDIKIEYVDTQWGTAVAGLQSNRFDILGGFNNTPERAKAVDFTPPYGLAPDGRPDSGKRDAEISALGHHQHFADQAQRD